MINIDKYILKNGWFKQSLYFFEPTRIIQLIDCKYCKHYRNSIVKTISLLVILKKGEPKKGKMKMKYLKYCSSKSNLLDAPQKSRKLKLVVNSINIIKMIVKFICVQKIPLKRYSHTLNH